MTRKQIRTEMLEIKKEMKELGIRRMSCFNGGMTREERTYNSRLFELSVQLSKCRD